MKLCDEGVDTLCEAIIYQAIVDYKKALESGDEYAVRALERFFYSDWFNSMSNIDVDWLIQCIREKSKGFKRRYEKRKSRLRRKND